MSKKARIFTDEELNPFLVCVFVVEGHTNSVQSVTFSPDGKRIVLGSGDTTVRMWDAETGKPVGEPF